MLKLSHLLRPPLPKKHPDGFATPKWLRLKSSMQSNLGGTRGGVHDRVMKYRRPKLHEFEPNLQNYHELGLAQPLMGTRHGSKGLILQATCHRHWPEYKSAQLHRANREDWHHVKASTTMDVTGSWRHTARQTRLPPAMLRILGATSLWRRFGSFHLSPVTSLCRISCKKSASRLLAGPLLGSKRTRNHWDWNVVVRWLGDLKNTV